MSTDRRFINYLVVLGAEPGALAAEAGKSQSFTLKAVALERFPSSDYGEVPLTPMLATLPDFCFQDVLRVESRRPTRESTPAFLSFALTTAKGIRLHVCCLVFHEKMRLSADEKAEVLYVPKAFCIVSQLPCLDTFRSVLGDMVEAARSDEKGRPRVSQLLAARLLYEVPLPPDPLTQVVFSLGARNIALLDQTFARDFSFRPLLSSFSIPRLAQLFLLVMLERKVVVVTKNMSFAFLSQTLEVLRALLFPFDWEHLYIPLLPPSMRWPLECPPPFLMGVPGGLDGVEVPDDVTVFDLDRDCTVPPSPSLPESMSVLPEALEEPLLRLKHAFPWEQQPANKAYWGRFHLVQLSAAGKKKAREAAAVRGLRSAMLAPPAPGEKPSDEESRAPHSSASPNSSGSDESDNVSLGGRSVRSVSSSRPELSADEELEFREKVRANFLEIFVVLLHDYPSFLREGRSPAEGDDDDRFDHQGFLEHVQQQVRSEDHIALLREFLQTNSWERFLQLPVEHPRVQLFQDAIDTYKTWLQEPAPSRRPLADIMRSWVARHLTPSHSVAASPHNMMPPPAKRRKQSRVARAMPLDLASCQMPVFPATPVPAAALPSPGLQEEQLPPDAVSTFAEAMAPAIASLRAEEGAAPGPLLLRLLTQLTAGAGSAEGPEMSLSSEELTSGTAALLPAAGNLDVEQLLEGNAGPEIVLRPTCLLHGFQDISEPCPKCKFKSSFWAVVTQAIKGADGDTGYAQVECRNCGRRWEPKFRLSSMGSPGSPSSIDIKPRELQAAPNSASMLLTVPECLSRIGKGRLEGCPGPIVLDTDADVFWCLQVFFGLRVELFRQGEKGLERMGFASYDALCKAYCQDRLQQASLAAVPVCTGTGEGLLADDDGEPLREVASSLVATFNGLRSEEQYSTATDPPGPGELPDGESHVDILPSFMDPVGAEEQIGSGVPAITVQLPMIERVPPLSVLHIDVEGTWPHAWHGCQAGQYCRLEPSRERETSGSLMLAMLERASELLSSDAAQDATEQQANESLLDQHFEIFQPPLKRGTPVRRPARLPSSKSRPVRKAGPAGTPRRERTVSRSRDTSRSSEGVAVGEVQVKMVSHYSERPPVWAAAGTAKQPPRERERRDQAQSCPTAPMAGSHAVQQQKQSREPPSTVIKLRVAESPSIRSSRSDYDEEGRLIEEIQQLTAKSEKQRSVRAEKLLAPNEGQLLEEIEELSSRLSGFGHGWQLLADCGAAAPAADDGQWSAAKQARACIGRTVTHLPRAPPLAPPGRRRVGSVRRVLVD